MLSLVLCDFGTICGWVNLTDSQVRAREVCGVHGADGVVSLGSGACSHEELGMLPLKINRYTFCCGLPLGMCCILAFPQCILGAGSRKKAQQTWGRDSGACSILTISI